MPLNTSEKSRIMGQLSSGASMATSLRPSVTSSSEAQQSSAALQQNVDHIVWDGVESSTGTNPSSDDRRNARNHMIDGILLLGESSSSASEYKSEKPALPTEGGTAPLQKVDLHKNALEDNDEEDLGEMAYRQTQFESQAHAREELIKQGINVEALVVQIPCDENGCITSIGSIGHFSQSCKEPCTFVNVSVGCANGLFCGFCHLAHTQAVKRKVKDGKAKRDRYRRLKERLMGQIDGDPYSFKLNFNGLPDWLLRDERLKAKLTHSLNIHQENARKQLVDL